MNDNINYAPLNIKVSNYIKRTLTNSYNVAEGAVRSTKTVDNIFGFVLNLEITEDYLHLACAYSTGIAISILGKAEIGLETIFAGRCKWGKYKKTDALFIQTKTKGEKVVLFVGGGKADSFKTIRGLSVGMVLATEINLFNESFLQEIFSRTINSNLRRFFFDLNPSNPKHWIYIKYIDVWINKNKKGEFLGGLNYEHFVLDDNLSISDERRKEIISQYDINSIWYKRDILGKRVVAEGRIYSKVNVIDEDINLCSFYSMGVDIGESQSAFTMILVGIKNNVIHVIDEYYHLNNKEMKSNKKGDTEYAEDVALFIKKNFEKHRKYPQKVLIDQNRPMFIVAVEKAFIKFGLPINLIKYAYKMQINERIRATQQLMTLERLKINSKCKYIIEALEQAVWCPVEAEKGKDVRLDDNTSNIDSLDAMEYACEPYFKRLIRG